MNITAAIDVKITQEGNHVWLSVEPTSGPLISVLHHILYHASEIGAVPYNALGSEITNFMKFKSRKLQLRFRNKLNIDRLVKAIDKACSDENKHLKERAAAKASAPERKKQYARFAREERKDKEATFALKFGKGTRKRIQYRQVGGDDGYQWTIFVDGRTFVNGLTRPEVDYYVSKAADEIAMQEHLGIYAN